MRGQAEHRAIGMPEDHMATTGLTAHEAVGFRHRLKALDSPIPWIGFHSGQRLRGFCHVGMILLVILPYKGGNPSSNDGVERRIGTGPPVALQAA